MPRIAGKGKGPPPPPPSPPPPDWWWPPLDAPLSQIVSAALPKEQVRKYLVARAVQQAADTAGVWAREQAVSLLWERGDLSTKQANDLYEIVKKPGMPQPDIPAPSFQNTRPLRGAGPWLQAVAGCLTEELEEGLAGNAVIVQRRLDQGGEGETVLPQELPPRRGRSVGEKPTPDYRGAAASGGAEEEIRRPSLDSTARPPPVSRASAA